MILSKASIRYRVLITAVIIAALALFSIRGSAQVIERPVPFDNNGYVVVMTPAIAAQAGLRPPWWPVSGDFTEARMFTSNDSVYVLAVTRRSGVVERYSLAQLDRDAIRATVSKLPREALVPRNDARNTFIRNQTTLGLLVYAPTFAAAITNNDASSGAAYLVVAGGTFFAASEISRRTFISRPMADLSTNAGLNGALAGWGITYLFDANGRTEAAGAFIGGVTGTALGLKFGRHLTEAEAVGAGFGSDIGALIAAGTIESIRGREHCTINPVSFIEICTPRRLSDKSEIATVLAAGLVGYPLGLLYPRNATANVTPGDIETLGTTGVLGATGAMALLSDASSYSSFMRAATIGGVFGIIAGDRLLVRRYDHGRSDASRLNLGTVAGALMGAGVAALGNSTRNNNHAILGLTFAGGVAGLMVTERYLMPPRDAGNQRLRLTFNPASIALIAARVPGNQSLFSVRF